LIPGGPASIPFAYFRVPDIDAAMKQTAELGGAVHEQIKSPAGTMAVCADDQGTVFSLWQAAPSFG
jgi:predicted enzyme related to lactoylglutathione lyase